MTDPGAPQPPTVWIDGRLRPWQEQVAPALGSGYAHGRGLFETIRLERGEPIALGRHLARLIRSAPRLGLAPPPLPRLLEAVACVAAERPEPLSRLKIQLSGAAEGAATLLVSGQALTPAPSSMAVGVAPWARNERSAVAGIKSTAYVENLLALEWAHQQGWDEALLADSRGLLSEATMTNVFLSLDGVRLLTPALSTGALPGIGRERLLEWLPPSGVPVEEVELPMARLGQAREVFLTNALRGVVPVSSVAGRALATPGPLTSRAIACFGERYPAERGLRLE